MRLYRYEPLARLPKMFSTGQVAFAHPTQWPDPYESAFLQASKIRMHGAVLGPDGWFDTALPRTRGSATSHWISSPSYHGRKVFGQCFSGCKETERMWLAAAKDQRVRWSIDADVYLSALRAAAGSRLVQLATVRYHAEEVVQAVHKKFVEKYAGIMLASGFPLWCKDVIEPLTTKRLQFIDESEHRFIVIDTECEEEDQKPVLKALLFVKLPLLQLVQDITLAPTISPTDAVNAEKQLRDAGYTGVVEVSKLYAKPELDHITENPFVD